MERRVDAERGSHADADDRHLLTRGLLARKRRDAKGASVVEYALLLALVLIVVFASVYALGRTPNRPASVIGQTFNSPSVGGGPPPSVTNPSSTTSSTTSTTAKLPAP
jgi:Flp pilus assembly pilin Flp